MKSKHKVHQDGRHMSESHLKNHHNAKAGKREPNASTSSVGGSNLKLPKPEQTITVAATKDKLAGNVGGGAHMMPSKNALGYQDLIESGGGKGIKKTREKY